MVLGFFTGQRPSHLRPLPAARSELRCVDHVTMIERTNTAASRSDLLFPSETGGYRSASCLNRPIAEVKAALGITKKFTRHYSTVAADEQRAGLAKVIQLVTGRRGDPSGDPETEKKKAG